MMKDNHFDSYVAPIAQSADSFKLDIQSVRTGNYFGLSTKSEFSAPNNILGKYEVLIVHSSNMNKIRTP